MLTDYWIIVNDESTWELKNSDFLHPKGYQDLKGCIEDILKEGIEIETIYKVDRNLIYWDITERMMKKYTKSHKSKQLDK